MGLFMAHPLKPDIKELNPVSGFKQLFGKKEWLISEANREVHDG